MGQRMWRLTVEGIILITILLFFKMELFPFFIQLWYPTGEYMDKMRDLIFLIIGMTTVFIYFGMGSCSRDVFQLSWKKAILAFFLWHIPFIFLGMLGHHSWIYLLSDLFALLIPSFKIDAVLILGIYLSIYLMGRFFYVSESDQKEISSKKLFLNVFSYSDGIEKNE